MARNFKTVQINDRNGTADFERKAKQCAKFLASGKTVKLEVSRKQTSAACLFTLTDRFTDLLGDAAIRAAGGSEAKNKIFWELS